MAATAWRLYSPSTSGGKVYDILLVERYVLVGWGSMLGTMQYKIERFMVESDARAWAVTQTETKEKKGYRLDGTVHVGTATDGHYTAALASRYPHRGSSTQFDLMFNDIYKAGARLK